MEYLSLVDDVTRLAVTAGQGDRAALAAFVRETQGDVWRLCAHLVDPDSADDLTQETFLRAFRQLKRFRGDGPVRYWLFTIARRTCAHEISSRQRRLDTTLTFATEQRSRIGDSSLQVELALLLEGLDPDRRAAFVLTQVLGCSYAETAQICECPIGTVRSRVARARDDLIQLTRHSNLDSRRSTANP